ncbi:MAG TPA: DUF4232 domain-containing protein [Trebonia sp.]|nr:DUF4232 domain-containing protein [Trebonia sp.]
MATLIVGCTSSGSSASSQAPTTSTTQSGAAVSTGAPTQPPSGGPTGTSSGAAGNSGTSPPATPSPGAPSVNPGGVAIVPCPTSGLKVTEGTIGAAGGSTYMQIKFTNVSGRTCLLYGYPGVALTTGTSAASQVGPGATRSTLATRTVVTLASGATASATLQLVEVVNYPSSACQPASGNYLQVYPPGQTVPVYLPFKGKTCLKPVFALGISAVKAAS